MSVLHLGFVLISSYCIRKLYFIFLTVLNCHDDWLHIFFKKTWIFVFQHAGLKMPFGDQI